MKPFSVLLLALTLLCVPSTGLALDRDQRAIAVGIFYGAGAGTVLGLASLPLARSGKGVFMGTSIGLYLGLVAALYHIGHREDPENPLRVTTAPAAREVWLPASVPAELPLQAEFAVYRF
ncbi:MAG: hypothetical protein NDJ89_14925 [Oligoflexia bacterium]|nr:hypothetical protein [Oligoflexia bacterium]